MKRPEISNYKYKISHQDGTIKEVFRGKEYVADLEAYWQEAYSKSEADNKELRQLLENSECNDCEGKGYIREEIHFPSEETRIVDCANCEKRTKALEE